MSNGLPTGGGFPYQQDMQMRRKHVLGGQVLVALGTAALVATLWHHAPETATGQAPVAAMQPTETVAVLPGVEPVTVFFPELFPGMASISPRLKGELEPVPELRGGPVPLEPVLPDPVPPELLLAQTPVQPPLPSQRVAPESKGKADFPAPLPLVPLAPAAKTPPASSARPQQSAAPVEEQPDGSPSGRGGRVALVIDDMGVNRNETRRALRLPAPVTFAFLPYAEDVQKFADEARANGHEVIVHLPMQPDSDAENPGPNALRIDLTDEELDRRIDWNLSRFTGYVGVNNHMGSRFTSRTILMDRLMGHLQQKGVFFLDSRTTGRSIARQVADRRGVPILERDVFLDHLEDASNVRASIERTVVIARNTGNAIAIGHPKETTLNELERWIPQARGQGVRLVKLSDLLPPRPTASVAP